ncbi:hypothetical protein EMCRGX_G002780 [Ephydatia muelleri]
MGCLSQCFKEEEWDRTLLGDLLIKAPHLESLNLSLNNLGNNGLMALCAASSSLSNLKDLNLSQCFKEEEWDRPLLGDLLIKAPHLESLK